MPSVTDRPASKVSSPLQGRQLISRIASPFASKSRNFTGFSIDVDDPHKQYSSGDLVQGSVRLRVLKPIRVTHIVVCLHGFVQVYKTPGSPGEGLRAHNSSLGTGRGKKSGEYFGNGFALLFEDEVVLCGDGRLAEGSYQFNFELEFPDRDLPSSIDFERGTITYVITATMTRPTTMMPTVSCDHKVYFVERIDVSPLWPPKPKTITLEPISRRLRAKNQARKLVDGTERRSRKADSALQSEQNRQSRDSSALSTQADSEIPESPTFSEISIEEQASSSGQLSRQVSGSGADPTSPGAAGSGRPDASKSSLASPSGTITATVESLTGGCLRGDNVAIKVSINHTKVIKSLYGVIVTLYRQARVDMHPAIPLGPTEKGSTAKSEEYYPKSWTGLGGLSLSGAGSSHVFRKDLTQVFAPLYVDPTTLSAEIHAKTRVPDEAFPTIATVPGAMISFKYYVEVVLDIQGKLGGGDRNLGNLGGVAGTPSPAIGMDGANNDHSTFTSYAPPIVDTAPIRRDKGVVTCTFEVIVGTRDSERRKGKRKAEPSPQHVIEPQEITNARYGETGEDGQWYNDSWWYLQQMQASPYMQPQPSHPVPAALDDHGYQQQQPPPVPMPQLEDDSQLSEKERMRRAEARLLPSQPPVAEESEADHASMQPTAPFLPEESDTRSHDQAPSARAYGEAPSTANDPQPDESSLSSAPNQELSAPSYHVPDPNGASFEAARTAVDDKQELERQRLQAEVSEPPLAGGDASTSAETCDQQPSAPTLADEEVHVPGGYDSDSDAAGTSGLPRYER